MNRQVITIGTGGEMSGLQRKKGQGLNLQTFGKAKTVRASEIVFAEDIQKWYVQPLDHKVVDWVGGSRVTTHALRRAMDGTGPQVTMLLDELCPSGWRDGRGGAVYCDDYDEAVKLEVWFLDKLRLRGVH